MDGVTLSAARTEVVLERLGLGSPPAADLDGLRDLYLRWCRSVPFDNVRKLIALRSGGSGPLPGMDPDDFFDAWLTHGTGGTCWPSAAALDALLRACGFDSRLVAASMADTGVASHGTTVVRLEGGDWLVDSSMLTEVPVRLSPTEATATGHAVLPTTAEPVDEGWLMTFPQASSNSTILCRTISPDAFSHERCVERYEVSREASPFNADLRARRNTPEGVVTIGGSTRYQRTAGGLTEQPLDAEARRVALVADTGLSEEIIDRVLEVLDRP